MGARAGSVATGAPGPGPDRRRAGPGDRFGGLLAGVGEDDAHGSTGFTGPRGAPVTARAELLVLGGGPTGLEAARAYREAGGEGEVVVLSADAHPPYQRPPLSKEYLRGESGEEALALEADAFYEDQGIDLRLGCRAVGLDLAGRRVHLERGEPVGFATCLVATGSVPARPPVRGADDPAVHYLRSRGDARRLRDAATRARSAVVVGSGFIGCEAAASLARRGLSVTLVTPEQVPQGDRLGTEAARRIAGWLSDEQVVLRLGLEAVEIEAARRVLLSDGSVAEADLLLVAAGVEPATGFLAGSGLATERKRVVVDDAMRSTVPGVLAAGDAALALHGGAGRRLAVEHWGEALEMGRIAGETAAGRPGSWRAVPGFWSEIGDRTLKYAGWGDGFSRARLVEHGGGSFTVWYGSDGTTVGVLTHDADEDYERGQGLVGEAAPLPDE